MKTQLLFAALFVNVHLFSQCYTVAPTTYIPDTSFHSLGTIAPVMDDHWSDVIPIGFPFCFYGNQYDSCIVGDNGLVSFEIQYALGYCLWPINAAVPNTSMPSIKNAIGLPYQDLYILPNSTHHIYYYTSGSQPNRAFTMVYDSIPMYSCSTYYFSGRLVLHETTNNIEMQIGRKDTCTGWNGANAIMGIENQAGTQATVVSGRNYPAMWTATQDAWVITPTCGVCAASGVAETNTGNSFAIYPNPSNGSLAIVLPENYPAVKKLEIIDVTGRIVQTKAVELSAGGRQEIVIDVPGMYFVRLYGEADSILSSQKLIVESE